nr:alpha/beta fold hydrolase [Micromonospora sp. DSM 115978]
MSDLDSRADRHVTPCGEGNLVWRCWGAGRPVLLLHGSHGSWLHWVRNVPALAASGQVWAPDLPGYGESSPPEVLDSPACHAEALAAGMRLLLADRAPVDVVGFSLGATIGAHLAVLAPELVRRLVVVDAGGLGTPTVTPDFRPLRGLEGEARKQTHRHNLSQMMFHDPANIDDLAMWIQLTLVRPRSLVHHEVLPDKLLRVLRQVPVQLDAIWGDHDRPHPNPAANVAVIREFQPEAELRTVRGAGHWSMYEGADEFNTHLCELFDAPLRPTKPSRPVGT